MKRTFGRSSGIAPKSNTEQIELKRCLKEMNKAQRIKIGAKNGTGWFYCGTVKRFLDNIDAYDSEIRSHWQKRLATAKENLREATRAMPSTEMVDDLIRWAKNIVTKCTRVERMTDINMNFVDIEKRKVLSTRNADKTIDPNTINIVIEGYEEGKFWTSDEAKRAKKCLSMKEGEEEDEE